METINGEFIMQGCEENDPNRLWTIDDLYKFIHTIGFVPLFSCNCSGLKGFSVEEHVTAEQWWTGDKATDPWEWRIIASRNDDIAYGKFFDKKAGFISKDWFPKFANYRREGYDYEALFEDELANYRSKKIMDALGVDDKGQSSEVMSNNLKARAGFGKRSDGSAGEKNFEGALTELQMQTYLIMSDFRQKKNKKGQDYGWHIAMISTPETKWGYDHVCSCYSESPEASWIRIKMQIKRFFPDAEESSIFKLLGIRWPSAASVENESIHTVKKTKVRKNPRPQELPWPENIIAEIGVSDVLGTDEYIPLSLDQQEGLSYAISILKENEQKAIRLRYEEHRTLVECGKEMGLSQERIRQIAKKGIRKLHHPTRAVYIREGYQGYLERKENEKLQLQKGLASMSDEERMEFLSGVNIALIGLNVRTYNCLHRAGLNTLADVVKKVEEGDETVHLTSWIVERKGLLGVRNLGMKSALEVLEKLEEYGVDISKAKAEYGFER